MDKRDQSTCTAFEGFRRIASGKLAQVALKTKKVIDRGKKGPILIFDDVTGEQLEVDFRGTGADVVKRIAKTTSEQSLAAVSADTAGEVPRGPGRPRLGRGCARKSSRCCRGIGIGLTVSPAVHRSRCGSLWRRRGASTRARTAFDGRKSRLTGSCQRWPAICPDSRRPRGPYSPGKQILSEMRFAVGPRMFGTYLYAQLVGEFMQVEMSGRTQKGRTG